MMKRIFIIGLTVGLFVVAAGCGKTDVAGKWEMTLIWDERSVFEGAPPPPTVLQLEFRDGKVFDNDEEVGYYMHRRGKRVKIRPAKLKVICYGDLIDDNHMEGDVSYFPSSEIYGTWKAKRLDISGPKR